MAKKPKAAPVADAVAEVVEQAVAAAAIPRSRGPRGVAETALITVLVEGNPKREGSQSHLDFAQYHTGMTVGAFCDLIGKRGTPHLVYDAAHGFISIEGYSPELVVAKERAPKAEKVAKERAPKAKKVKAEPAEQTHEQAELEGVTTEETMD
jgi:hypothetical protein